MVVRPEPREFLVYILKNNGLVGAVHHLWMRGTTSWADATNDGVSPLVQWKMQLTSIAPLPFGFEWEDILLRLSSVLCHTLQ